MHNRALTIFLSSAPEITGTLYYQPMAAGVMLFFYLFIMIVLIGSLLVASFLTTMLREYAQVDQKRRIFVVRRVSVPVQLGIFIPNVLIELVVGFVHLTLKYVFRINNNAKVMIWLEKLRQVLWYIVFLPVILLVALFEGLLAVVTVSPRIFSGYIRLKVRDCVSFYLFLDANDFNLCVSYYFNPKVTKCVVHIHCQ